MNSGEANVRGESLETFKDHAREFLKAVGEMSVEFGKGCRDIVKQTLVNPDSLLVRKFGRRIGGTSEKLRRKLNLLDEYLPEDKDPVYSFSVILFVVALAFAGELF